MDAFISLGLANNQAMTINQVCLQKTGNNIQQITQEKNNFTTDSRNKPAQKQAGIGSLNRP
jgi:hypothetical protein